MSTGSMIFLGLLVAAVVWVVAIYNGLITSRNAFKNAFSQIDVQLQRRYDLIPNLVETAKGYMKHERETLEAVILARNQAAQAAKAAADAPESMAAIGTLSGAEGMLGSALGRMFALMENYPDLKANETMKQLMEELTSTENKVSFARQAFNDSVMHYNNDVERFPNSVVAGAFNFKQTQLLELEEPEARKPVKVDFAVAS